MLGLFIAIHALRWHPYGSQRESSGPKKLLQKRELDGYAVEGAVEGGAAYASTASEGLRGLARLLQMAFDEVVVLHGRIVSY